MNTPAEMTLPAEKTSAKTMAILLVLALLGALLNSFGIGVAFSAILSVPTGYSGFSFFSQSQSVAQVIILAVLAFIIFWASFLTLSLYPVSGRRQMIAGFCGCVAMVIGAMAGYLILNLGLAFTNKISFVMMMEISLGVGITVCLIVSGRVKSLSVMIGLVLGLAIGIALCNVIIDPSHLNYPMLWLSAVLFSELLSRRAGWGAVLIGALFWVSFVGLEVFSKFK